MSELLDILQQRHNERLDQLKGEEAHVLLIGEARILIADLREAGASIADPSERGQLRALMRFWASVIYRQTGAYPDTQLLPPNTATTRVSPRDESARGQSNLPLWVLTVVAALLVVVAGVFVTLGWQSLADGDAGYVPTPAPIPFIRQAVVGAISDGEDLPQERGSGTFCVGIPEIIADFELENVGPGAQLHWELQHTGKVIAAQPAAPWKENDALHITIRIRTPGQEVVEPGHYDLLVFSDEQAVGVQSFRVLDSVPGLTNLRVSDVPSPGEEALQRSEFEGGVRMLYFTYEYEGICPGLDISYSLYREGEQVREISENSGGSSSGKAQVSLQAAGALPFPPGNYELVASVEGVEQETIQFSVLSTLEEESEREVTQEPEPEPTPTMEPGLPVLGNITTALGVQPDGTPILSRPSDRFNWNNKVIYGIFDYSGMRDGLPWAAVWSRNGQELVSQEGLWDVDIDGAKGTKWVTYFNDNGQVLPGGSYSVTVTIDDDVERTVDFTILYYEPPE